jgi:FkbM family methyltransferase
VFAFDPMLADSAPPQGNKFKSHKVVLSDKKSELDFYLESSSAIGMPGFLESKISVSGDRFDSILDREKISKNPETLFVMKIDVEGFELNVLKGCGKYLEQLDIIQFEIGEFTQQANHSLRSFIDLIGPSYQFYVISTVYGLIPINLKEDSIFSDYLTANFVAIKKIRQR